MCFGGGVALIVAGIFSLIQIFNIVSQPIYYIVNAYQVFFGVVTCITEMKEEFAGKFHTRLEHIQEWMHKWAKGLTLLWGRGLFYIFQGLLCTVSCFNGYVGLLIGLYVMAMGMVCVQQHFK